MAAVAAIVAVVVGCSALFVAVRCAYRQRVVEAELASLVVTIGEERDAVAASVASAHASTIDEVTTLVENILVQLDTEIAARVAEALAASGGAVDCPGAHPGDEGDNASKPESRS